MRISPDLVFGLRDRGIIVRWFPEKTFEEFKQRVWQQQYENYVSHIRYSDHCFLILFSSIQQTETT